MSDSLILITRGAYALAYQLVGKKEDAMDIIQDASATALSHQSAPLSSSEEFKPWFYQVVRNRALDQLRRKQRFTHESFEEQHFEIETTNPEQALEQLELKETIHKALMNVSFEQREIILLKDFHSFRYAEIAAILDIPKGSVMSRLHRSRLALRKVLEKSHKLEGVPNA